MGVFDKLRKRKSKITPTKSGDNATEAKTAESVFSAADFNRSQQIYDRSLIGVSTYEIQSAVLDDAGGTRDLFVGELVEITEGLMTLRVIAGGTGGSLFVKNGMLSVSYSKSGESFCTTAGIVEVTIAGFGKAGAGSMTLWKYIVEVVFLAEPVRHRRKHGRIDIEWDVYYKPDDGVPDDDRSNYFLAKTIDISLGGFKGTVTRPLARGTEIKCMVDVGFDLISKGSLKGEVVRCYPMSYDDEIFEMTVRFTEMDDEVMNFLCWWIENIQPTPVNSIAVISVSEDGTRAAIELMPPENNGEDLTYDALCKLLEKENIKNGVDHDLLRSIGDKPHYNLKYTIARAEPPEHGKDAVLECHVDMNPSFAPRINEEGIADFKDLGHIHKVSVNDLLAERTPPTEGKPGISVTGEVLPAISGKDEPLPAGANTVVSDDGTQLFAGMDGYVSITDGNISVLDTYVVEGDVQSTTGNINHNGIVIVKGDVRQNFSVIATGDVVVNGTVESATIKAGGTLVVKGGCVGEGNNLEVNGNAAVMFIDGGYFKVGGSLTTSYILNSKITCGESVDMVNSGLIRNSHVIAKNAINAKTVGSMYAAADNTIVEVGNDPEMVSTYARACEELDKLTKELDIVKANIRGLTVKKHKDELTPKMAEALEVCKLQSAHLTAQQAVLADHCKMLKAAIDTLGYGTVIVTDIAYEGFKVVIGPRDLILPNSVKAAKFCRKSVGVVIIGIDEEE